MKILKITLLIIVAMLLVVPAFMLSKLMNEPCTSIGWDSSVNEFKYVTLSPERCSNIAGVVKHSGKLFLTDEGLGIKFDGDYFNANEYQIDPPIQFFIRDNRDWFFNKDGLSKQKFEFEGIALRPSEWTKKDTLYIHKIKIIGHE